MDPIRIEVDNDRFMMINKKSFTIHSKSYAETVVYDGILRMVFSSTSISIYFKTGIFATYVFADEEKASKAFEKINWAIN